MARYKFDEAYVRELIEDRKMTQVEALEHLRDQAGAAEQYGLSERSLRRFCQQIGISRNWSVVMDKYEYDEVRVRHMVETLNMSHDQVYQQLLAAEGGEKVRGLSARSIQRFCKSKGISNRSGIADEQLDDLVAKAVETVGPSYGHRTLRGYLLASGEVNVVSKHRIRASLVRVDPLNAAARRVNLHRKINPQRYHAPYFGYNLHVDQNEKLVDYGIVYAAAIDGHSSYVFDIAVMPRKNNLTIYRDLFKPIVEQFGVFYKVHADGGSEFLLTLFMQQYFWGILDPERDPFSTFRQTKSTMNNRIERYWEENNERITYYMKDALILLERAGCIDASIPHHLYSISQVGMMVAKFGATLAANSWNYHHIENRGKPIMVARANDQTKVISHEHILDVDAAKQLYRLRSEQQRGPGTGQLTEESVVGTDLLATHGDLSEQRDRTFLDQVLPQCGGTQYVFGRMVNCEYGPFQNLVYYHLQLTERLYANIGN